MIFLRGLRAVFLVVSGMTLVAGCQSPSTTAQGESVAPSFGRDIIPRQSEPELDGVAVARTVPLPESASEDEPDESTGAEQGNLLTRLIPGRDKGKDRAERKSLPVNERTAAADDDLDGLDF
jgi:hypothetical protein